MELRLSFTASDSTAGDLYRKWQQSDAGGKYYNCHSLTRLDNIIIVTHFTTFHYHQARLLPGENTRII